MVGTGQLSLGFLIGLLVLTLPLRALGHVPLPLPRQSSDEAVLRGVIEEYYAAYAEKSLDKIFAKWSSKSPLLEARRKSLAELFAGNDRFRIANLTMRQVKFEGAGPVVRVSLDIIAIGPPPTKPAPGPGRVNRTFHFVNEAGKWMIWNEESTEDELSAEIENAKSQEARKDLIAAEKDFLTPQLATAIARQGIRLRNQSRSAEAMERFELSKMIAGQIGDHRGLVVALTLLSNAYYQNGDFAKSIELDRESLRLSETLPGNHLLIRVLINIAATYSEIGEPALAEQLLRRALPLTRASNDKQMTAHALIGMATALEAQDNHAAALRYLQEGLALSKEIGYELGVGMATEQMGLLYQNQGDYGQALALLQRQKVEAAGDGSAIAVVEEDLGEVYVDLGDYQKALQSLDNALRQFQQLGNKLLIGSTLNRIASAYYRHGDFTRALAYCQQSLQVLASTSDKDRTTSALILQARCFYATGHYVKGLQAAERASVMARDSDARGQLLAARLIAGRIHRSLNQPDQAEAAYKEAIAQAERIRDQVAGGGQERERFFEDATEPYYDLVSLLVAENKVTEAFEYAERAKGRVLLDALQHRESSITKAMTPEEQQQERGLRIAMASLNARMRRESVSQDQKADLLLRLEKARLNYEDFRTKLYAAHPELRTMRGEAPRITSEEAAAVLPDSRTVLLEYVVTENATLLFSLTRTANKTGADLKAYSIPLKRKDAADLVNDFREQLASRDLKIREPARRLYDLLLRPAQAELNGKTNIVIAPDGVLWDLPFQVLVTDSDHYLIEESAISYTQSCTALREMIAHKKQREPASGAADALLAVGNPVPGKNAVEYAKYARRDGSLSPLPEAEREVKMLSRFYRSPRTTVLIGAKADENRVKSDAPRFNVLHFATHAILDDQAPMYSYLVLADGDQNQDGLLEAWELMDMNLQAELVVLSACETARGRVGKGEGVIGLSWALFVAGCPTVVVSQWKVDSASTTELMVDFHRKLTSGNPRITTAGALRAADLDLLKTPEYSNPYYWAGFVVVGDGF